MESEKDHPSWWQLYLLVLGLLGLLVGGVLAPMSAWGHQVAAIGTLVLAWIMMELWLRANTAALLRIDGLVLVPRSPEGEKPASGDEPEPDQISRRPLLGADDQWPAESAPALQEREGLTC